MTIATDAPRMPLTDADILLIGLGTDAAHRMLLQWQEETPGLHDFMPDYHRLQLEHWIWSCAQAMDFASKRVLDIGAQNPRRWIGPGYQTFGNTVDSQNDVVGDLLNLASSVKGDRWDVILCTEVLEHCGDPFIAARELRKTLAPGGLLLATSPFCWPDHHTQDYPDYWRFTEQGWRHLFRHFSKVDVTACAWTSEAQALLDLVRRFEGWGFRHHVGMTTGYLVEAWK